MDLLLWPLLMVVLFVLHWTAMVSDRHVIILQMTILSFSHLRLVS